jgi:hypothetical protein
MAYEPLLRSADRKPSPVTAHPSRKIRIKHRKSSIKGAFSIQKKQKRQIAI